MDKVLPPHVTDPSRGERSSLLEFFGRAALGRSRKPSATEEALTPLLLALRNADLISGTPIEEEIEALFRSQHSAKEWGRCRRWPSTGLPELPLEILGWCLSRGAFTRARKWEERISEMVRRGPRQLALLRAYIDETLLCEIRMRCSESRWQEAYDFAIRTREFLGSLRPEGDLLLARASIEIRRFGEADALLAPFRKRFPFESVASDELGRTVRAAETLLRLEHAKRSVRDEQFRDAVKMLSLIRDFGDTNVLGDHRATIAIFMAAALFGLARYAQAAAELAPAIRSILDGSLVLPPEFEQGVVCHTFARSALLSRKREWREDALRAAAFACERHRDSIPIAFTHALLLLWNERYQESLTLLRATNPGSNLEFSAESAALKSLAYARLGNQIRALELYEEAKRKMPDAKIFKILNDLFGGEIERR